MEAIYYSKDECVELILMYGECGRNIKATARAYQQRFPEHNQPSESTILRIVTKFRETGSVGRKKYSQRERPITNEEASIDIVASVEVAPRVSIRQRADAANMSRASVHRILKREKVRPYKCHRVQELHGDDFDRRTAFCGWFMNQEGENPDFPANVMTTDEASFHLSGTVNTQNSRYWSAINPHWIRQDHRQVNPRINVWCGIYKDRLVGPVVIPQRLTGFNYLQVLNDILDPFLEDMPLADLRRFWFQQDGAPPHYAAVVREHLNVLLPDRWIGRGGPVEWPPRSPDLNPLDFFLWGYLKCRVYEDRPETLQELQENIERECANITPATIHAVIREWSARVTQCYVGNGRHFEHLH